MIQLNCIFALIILHTQFSDTNIILGRRVCILMNISALEKCGIDYSQGLERFMNNAELYESLLGEFVRENDFKNAKDALESGDMKLLF